MSRLLVAVLLLLLLPAGPAAAQDDGVGAAVAGARVVVVGAPGLRWDDVDRFRTPTLHRLADGAARGALSVKALPAVSCPADGWLTLAAGARAEAFDAPCPLPDPAEIDLEEQAERNLATRDAADVAALSAALREAGLCLAAHGPGAVLAGGDPARACPVVLVDAPAVSGEGDARTAAAVDEVVADVDAARPPQSTLLVVGLSGAPGDDEAHLHVAVAAGPTFPPGGLTSASTRRAPYVQLVDVAPTVLELVDVARPEAMAGRPWQATGEGARPADLADLDLRAVEAKRAQVPFIALLLGALLAGMLVALRRRSWAVAELVGLAVVAAVTGSYLAGAVPWHRTPLPLVTLVAFAAAAGVAGALAARRLRSRPRPVGAVLRPVGAVTTVLAGVLVLDLLTGARLQIDTPAGYSPLVAGRFAGIGNVAFGVYAAAVLLSLAVWTAGRSPRAARAIVGTGGAVAVVVDGAPPFGSDVGGVLALVPALVLLGMLRSGQRVTWPRLVAAGLGGVLLVTLFALADHARPEADRTHLGRFVEQVRDGAAGGVLERKATAIADLLLANPATMLLPVVVAVAVWLVVRPPGPLAAAFAAAPAWRHGLVAVGAASALGFALNDSGPAVPALALLVAGPATLAVCARVAARREQADRAGG